MSAQFGFIVNVKKERIVETPDDGGFCFGLTFNPCDDCGSSPVTLVYCVKDNPHPIVALDVDVPAASTPASYDVTLKINGTQVTTANRTVPAGFVQSGAASTTARLAVQFDASSYATGYYDYQVELQARDSNGGAIGTAKTLTSRMAIVNRAQSEFGNRWWLPVLDRLDVDQASTQGVGLIRGDGSANFFRNSQYGYQDDADEFETLSVVTTGNKTEYVVEAQDGSKRYFDQTLGLLQRIEDRTGHTQTLTYSDVDGDSVADELTKFDDGFGGITTFAYSGGLLSSVTDASRVTWTYEHDATRTLSRAYGPTKTGTTFFAEAKFEYDQPGTGNGTLLMTSHKDVIRGTTQIGYDFAARRVTSVTQNGVTETRSTAETKGLGTSVVAASAATGQTTLAGGTHTRTYDTSGRVIAGMSPSPTGTGTVEIDYVRNVSGQIREVHTPNPAGGAALVSKLEYNSRGLVTKVTNPDATSRSYTYASNGLDVLSETDERGKTWQYEYEIDATSGLSTGNRTKITDPTGRVTRYEYYASTDLPNGALKGMLARVIQQKGITASTADDLMTEYKYDERGNVVRVTLPDPDGTGGPLTAPFRTYVYDLTKNSNGQSKNTLTSETDERGNTTTYTYDEYNRLKTVTLPDPDGAGPLTAPVWLYDFCTCGHLMSVTGADPDGAGPLLAPVWTNTYDNTGQNPTGRLLSSSSPDPDGTGPRLPLKTKYEYDTNGRLWKVSNAVENPDAADTPKTIYEYDSEGRLTKVTQPDPDGAGSLLAPVWDYSYDALGRLVKVTGPDPDGAGSQSRPETNYSYDALGRVATETDPTGRVATYFYLPNGRVEKVGAAKAGATLVAPGPLTQVSYDDAGRMLTVTGPDPDGAGPLSSVASYAYDGFGRVSSVTAPDPDGAASASPVVVLAQGTGGAGEVKVFDAATGTLKLTFDPFPAAGGETRVAVGDVNGDGTFDIVATPAAGNTPVVRVFDGKTGVQLAGWVVFESGYTGPVAVAVADVTGDGTAEILVANEGARASGKPTEVKVYDATGRLLSQFGVFDASYNLGVRLAAGDFNGDGKAEAVVAMPGTASTVRIYDPRTGQQKASWDNYSISYTAGLFVAAGNVNTSAGDEVIVGSGNTGEVKVYSIDPSTWAVGTPTTFIAQGTGWGGGARVGTADVDGDGRAEVLASRGTGSDSGYVAYDVVNATTDANRTGPWTTLTGGAFIAGGASVIDRAAAQTKYEYDGIGRVTKETAIGGRVTTYAYDAAGNVTKVTRTDPDGAINPAPLIVTGQGATGVGEIRVLELDGSIRFTITPFSGYTGEVRVAAGDVNGDGVGDIIATPGSGFADVFRVFDGRTGVQLSSQYIFNPASEAALYAYDGGYTVAAGDVNGDGRADVIVGNAQALPTVTGLNPSGYNIVRVFDALTGAQIGNQFTPYSDAGFKGGVRVAAADVDNDGKDEVVVSLPSGFVPVVRVYRPDTGAYINSWYAYSETNPTAFTYGVFVAAGDTDGDGKEEVICGPGGGSGSTIRIFNAESSTVTLATSFAVWSTNWTGGVRVGATDVDFDGDDDVLTAVGAGGTPYYSAHNGQTGVTLYSGVGSDPSFTTGGLWIAGGAGQLDGKAPVTEYDYDGLGRLTKTTESFVGAKSWQKKTTAFAYDALGRRTSLTDASGNVTAWTYDALGRVLTETDPRAKVKTYTYDASGDLATKTDRENRITEYDFDALRRLIAERWLVSGQVIETISFTYDAWGRLLAATTDVAGTTEGDSTVTYTYDAAGRVLTSDNGDTGIVPQTVLTATYDALGRRDKLSAVAGGLADFVNTYAYDDAGHMTQVTQKGLPGGNAVAEKRVDLAWDALGRLDLVTRYASLTDTSKLVATSDYAYDALGRVTKIAHEKGTTSLAEYRYAYDDLNRLVWGKGPADTVSYSYDPSGQLAYADHSNQTDENYGYDRTGNRIGSGQQVATGNRVTEDANYTYQFSDEGNLARETKKSDSSYIAYTWDHRNRLTKAEFRTSAGVLTKQVAYDYDAFDRLVRRRLDAAGDGTYESALRFVYDGTQAVLVFDESGAVKDRMLWGPQVDQLFADENSVNGVLWSLTDNLGSVRDLVTYNSTANATTVADRIDYNAFGSVVSETAPSIAPLFKFTGRYFDPDTGKQWNLLRWYDSRTGRWLSQDPIGFVAGDANLSRYVGNSPTNATDPSGLEEKGLGAVVYDDTVGTVAGAYDSYQDAYEAHPVLTSILGPGGTLAVQSNLAVQDALWDAWGDAGYLPWYQRPYVAGGGVIGETIGVGDFATGVSGLDRNGNTYTGPAQAYRCGTGVLKVTLLVGGVGYATRNPAAGPKTCPAVRRPKLFEMDSSQLGKKLGAHVEDFGLDPSNPTHRAQVIDLINDIGRYPERSVPGTFRGQGPGGARGPVEFRIQGNDVVVTTPGGTFVSILKGGISNPSVLEALKNAGH